MRNGRVSIGHQINPKLFLKRFAKKNGIEKEQITVEGRKHNFSVIRQNLLMKHSKFMLFNNHE